MTPSTSRYLLAASARSGTAIATWLRRPTLGGAAAAEAEKKRRACRAVSQGS